MTGQFKDNSSFPVVAGTVLNATGRSVYIRLKDTGTRDLSLSSTLEFFTANTGALSSSSPLPRPRFTVLLPPCTSGTLDVFPQVPATMLQPMDQSDLLQLVAVTSNDEAQVELLTSTPHAFLPVSGDVQPGQHGRIIGREEVSRSYVLASTMYNCRLEELGSARRNA